MQAPAREYSPAVVIPPTPPNLSTAVDRCIDYFPFGETIPAGTGSRPACYGATQPVSIFQNSFAPPPSAVFVGLNPGAILGPWLVGGDGIDHIGAYWQSADGDQASIDLSGTGPGSITTSLSTLSGWTTGATYRVSFSLAANPDNTLSPQSCVRATTASSQQDYCFNVLNTDGQGTPASSANMGWQRHTFEFTGAPTDHLTFTSLDAPGDGWGPALDNITVEKLVPTTGPGVRHLFTGKERDVETGLDYFGARYLSAAQGRFTSADAPFADQFAENPQSWNLYSYTRNNPLKYVDPDGRRVRICITGGLCFDVEDGDYINLEAGNPGVVLPEFRFGRDEFGIGEITCGGQACGTATYINDNPGLTPVLHPLQDLRDQIAPLNPRNWLGAGIRGNVKTFAAQSGRGRPQIHSGKQGKHIPGHNNFQPGKSELTHPNPQALLDRSAGKGQRISTSKEAVDFGETIGIWVGPQGQRATTTKGVIHYDSSGGAHIVPARP